MSDNPLLILPASLLIGGAIFVLVYGWGYISQVRVLDRRIQERLTDYGGSDEIRPTMLERLMDGLEAQIVGTSVGEWAKELIEDADLNWRVSWLVGILLVLFILASVSLNLLLAINLNINFTLSFLAAVGLAYSYLLNRKGAYAKALQVQVPDIAHLLGNSLRAGQSLYFALQEVEQKMPRPAKQEFRRVRLQIDLGESIDRALQRLLNRFPSEEMRMLVMALLIQRQAGGDLVSTLATISSAIHARRRLRNEIDTITSEARQTSFIVLIFPFVILIILNRVSPGMVAEYLNWWPWGLLTFLAFYVTPQIIAFYVIRRIGDVKV